MSLPKNTDFKRRAAVLRNKKGAKAIKIFVPQQITYLKNENGDWIQLSKADKQLQLEYKRVTLKATKGLDSA